MSIVVLHEVLGHLVAPSLHQQIEHRFFHTKEREGMCNKIVEELIGRKEMIQCWISIL